MKRSYSNGSQDTNTVSYFVGTEVERTAALGQHTLFVVGNQSAESILDQAKSHNVTHIYIGANKSFEPWPELCDTVSALLKQHYWVTVDFHSAHWAWCMENLKPVLKDPWLVLMVSVEMPEVSLANSNTVIKIDDVGMAETNPGVWCHSLECFITEDAITTWDRYTDDEIIGDQS